MGNPIRFIDPNGKAAEDIIIKGSPEFVSSTFSALQSLTNDKLVINPTTGQVTVAEKGTGDLKYGTALVRHLTSEKTNDVNISESTDGTNGTESSFDAEGKISKINVKFNPDRTSGGIDVKGSFERPVQIGLGHELIHASHRNDSKRHDEKVNVIDPDSGEKAKMSKEEIQTRKEENILRNEQGVPARQTPTILE